VTVAPTVSLDGWDVPDRVLHLTDGAAGLGRLLAALG
jgi:hypothetical protein